MTRADLSCRPLRSSYHGNHNDEEQEMSRGTPSSQSNVNPRGIGEFLLITTNHNEFAFPHILPGGSYNWTHNMGS